MAGEASTVIGKGIQILGEISGGEDLLINGLVEGSISLTEGRLTLGPTAQVKADLKAKEILIAGKCEGNVFSEGRVELRKGASLQGDVTAARLSIEDGAEIQGKVSLDNVSK